MSLQFLEWTTSERVDFWDAFARKVKPNWEKWSRLYELEVWRLICLSFDIEPTEFCCVQKYELLDYCPESDVYSKFELEYFRSSELQERFEILLSWSSTLDFTLRTPGLIYSRMSIENFKAWAAKVNIELPDGFGLKYKAVDTDKDDPRLQCVFQLGEDLVSIAKEFYVKNDFHHGTQMKVAHAIDKAFGWNKNKSSSRSSSPSKTAQQIAGKMSPKPRKT
jgi:hypothetical protein